MRSQPLLYRLSLMAQLFASAWAWYELGEGYCRCASGDPRPGMGLAVCAVVGRNAPTNSSCMESCEQWTSSTCLGASWGSNGGVCIITVSNRLDTWSPAQDYQAGVLTGVGSSSSDVTCYSRYEACGLGWYAPVGRNTSYGDCQPCPDGSTTYNPGSTWCACLNNTQYWDFESERCVPTCPNSTVAMASAYCDVCPPGTVYTDPITCTSTFPPPTASPLFAALFLGLLCICCAAGYSRYRRRQVPGGALSLYRAPDGTLVYAALPASDALEPVTDAYGRSFEPLGYVPPPHQQPGPASPPRPWPYTEAAASASWVPSSSPPRATQQPPASSPSPPPSSGGHAAPPSSSSSLV